MALERFDMILNTPSLPSHHFSVRPGGGGSNVVSPSYPGVAPAGGGGVRGQDKRSQMKVTNFDPGQDYHTLLRQHSSTRLFEVSFYGTGTGTFLFLCTAPM